MTIKVGIEHAMTYEFDRTVGLGPHVVRLRPAPHCRTPIEAYSMRVDPEEHFLNWQQDPFGNFEARLVFPERSKRLEIIVDLVADMTVINPFDFFLEQHAQQVPFTYSPQLANDLRPYLRRDERTPLLREWLDGVDHDEHDTILFLVAINKRLSEDIGYTIRLEPGVQTPEETLEKRIGSCRDSAWLLVHIMRHLGIAARFASGYLVQLTSDVEALDGPSGPTADFTDLHAWTEVFLPGAGWVGLDPTSGLFAGEGHIPLACTPSPGNAAPIEGAIDECEVEFSYHNVVSRVHEDPRVTLPYTDEQWAAIDALGTDVDERLVRGDVRLTMGGEPTFVSIDDMEAPEWNTTADGPAKRALGAELTERLFDRFADGGVVHHGQGKWYPGEPLPRWQHQVVWRIDGTPLWRDRALLADPFVAGDTDRAAAESFVDAVASRLGVGTSTIEAAYEDPIHELWQEVLLPSGDAPDDLDPLDDELTSRSSRARLADAIDARAGSPTGWVLPIHRALDGTPRWATSEWKTRRSHLFLLPGDSPVGYRLPVQSLAWDPFPPDYEPSPFAQLRPFPDDRPPSSTVTDAVLIEDGAPPTAMCVEVRNGQLHVFLPPIATADEAAEVLTAIEDAAAAGGHPIVIEGYPLPTDSRFCSISVAPDPGVIEVNVQPARSWDELQTIVNGVHEDARQSRLGAEKFDHDGTHTGTGGGNHITLGGPTAADSPMLRRPDLLRSMVTYWQHHPSLSYLFSGRFIGPSSQAPRVDEARDDSIYELDTAFDTLDAIDGDAPPWIVDRAMRNLLVDLTGNTHRAEFCIDKLFSPDSERGRLGLLELRAFEMPPHPRMALVQALLVRSIVARCWDEPYQHRPVRWGTALHDRYLLPHFVETDIAEVVDDLQSHGIDFDPAWLSPFTEFRFPRHGTVQLGDVRLELRGAIEPWHVLGEEATGSGMARYVDSSVERVQVEVDGLTRGRHVVACNGVELPLTATETPGRFVAGVRFKAWAPPSGLHPMLGIDSPLTFDLVDTWSQRSIGGCRYHVVHPGGRSYDRPPINAVEAESRRQKRFEPIGHTPGRFEPTAHGLREHAEYPVTLDLRRVRRR